MPGKDYPLGANLWNLDGDSLGLPASPFQWRREKGDLDGSGGVNIFDLLDLLWILRDPSGRTVIADLDENSKVDIFDLLALLVLMRS